MSSSNADEPTPSASDTAIAASSSPSPLATGRVDGIYITEIAGEFMKELKTAEVIAHRGIKGDRYCMRKGTYSVFRTSTKHPGRREPGRQLTIVAAEGVEAALITHGIKAFGSLGDFRRNIVTRGVPAEVLQNAVGREIRLGDEVVVFAHRICVPCLYNERKNCRDGLMEATWDVCGISCEVLEGGTLTNGDKVVIAGGDADAERIDGGAQAPGFYLRPSQRNKNQVVTAANMLSAALPRLLEVDPSGVARALESYHSVGLSLFKRPKRFRRAEMLQQNFGKTIIIFSLLVVVMLFTQHGGRWYKNGEWPFGEWPQFMWRHFGIRMSDSKVSYLSAR